MGLLGTRAIGVVALSLAAAAAAFFVPLVVPAPTGTLGIVLPPLGVAVLGYLAFRRTGWGIARSLGWTALVAGLGVSGFWAFFVFVVVPGIQD